MPETPRTPRCQAMHEEGGQCELREGHEFDRHLAGMILWKESFDMATTPDTLASLIAEMEHNDKWGKLSSAMSKTHKPEHCDGCRFRAALDALAEKWRSEWRDGKDEPEKRQHQLFGKLECADELDGTGAELRGKGASEKP